MVIILFEVFEQWNNNMCFEVFEPWNQQYYRLKSLTVKRSNLVWKSSSGETIANLVEVFEPGDIDADIVDTRL
jgi:hypothetical protein